MRYREKIRVAWLAPYPPELLAPELVMVRNSHAHPATWIVNLADALGRRNDIDLHILTATSGIVNDQTVSKDGVTFHVLRHTFPLTARGFPAYLRLDLLTRYTILRRKIDRALTLLDPEIIHVHGTESVYGLASIDAKAPVILSIQGIVNVLRTISPSIPYLLQSGCETTTIRRTKYFGSRTAWANRFIRSLNPKAKIYEMPEAMNRLFFSQNVRPNKSGSKPRSEILFVGSLERRKGIEDALEAMRKVIRGQPAATLLVVGAGRSEYVAFLKERSRQAGIESHVQWLGPKCTAEVAALHNAATLLIHPTHIDNSPNSVAEAMCSGLPVIASDVGGIPSMVTDRDTGVLTPVGDPDRLADAITWLLKDESERRRIAERARIVARRRHYPDVVAHNAVNVYRDVLAREAGFHTGHMQPTLFEEYPCEAISTSSFQYSIEKY